jgi:predicted flap endonuclease-1-like 5' DNA nuclease
MFEEWLKFWRQWMFWWLPGGDEPDKDKPTTGENQPATPTASETEPADVDAATTGPLAPGEPAGPTPKTDDLTEIKGIGPAIVRKLDGLGVRTFADLAAADAEDLADEIASRPVTAARVREWVVAAKKRVS